MLPPEELIVIGSRLVIGPLNPFRVVHRKAIDTGDVGPLPDAHRKRRGEILRRTTRPRRSQDCLELPLEYLSSRLRGMIPAVNLASFSWRTLTEGAKSLSDSWQWSLLSGCTGVLGFTLIGSPLWHRNWIWPGVVIVILFLGVLAIKGAYLQATLQSKESEALIKECTHLRTEAERRKNTRRRPAGGLTILNSTLSGAGGHGIYNPGNAPILADGLTIRDVGGNAISGGTPEIAEDSAN